MQVTNYTGTRGISEQREIKSLEEGLALKPYGMFMLWDKLLDEGYVFQTLESDVYIRIVNENHQLIREKLVSMEVAGKIFQKWI